MRIKENERRKIFCLMSVIILLQGYCKLKKVNRSSAKAGCKIGYFTHIESAESVSKALNKNN